MDKDGVFAFVDKVIEVKGLEKGKDFEVVSMTVLTDDFDLITFDKFKEGNALEIARTPFPQEATGDFVLYKMNELVDIPLATECGLGVVKMMTGEDAGSHAIYFPFYGTNEWDDIDEIIALKIYLQLKHPEIYFDKLDNFYHEHMDLIESLIIINTNEHMKRLSTIFKTYNANRSRLH